MPRRRIVGLRETGWSFRCIADRGGRDVTSTSVPITRRTSGRPQSTNERRRGRTDLAHENPNVPPCTVGDRVLAAGLQSRIPLARLPLTPNHRWARLAWCNGGGETCCARTPVTVARVCGCVRPRHIGPTPGGYDARSSLVFRRIHPVRCADTFLATGGWVTPSAKLVNCPVRLAQRICLRSSTCGTWWANATWSAGGADRSAFAPVRWNASSRQGLTYCPRWTHAVLMCLGHGRVLGSNSRCKHHSHRRGQVDSSDLDISPALMFFQEDPVN
ncbi:Protein of unknown function [Gryllus bimaculatus]|nr:Protein of unknown function [Gryllus bimaculatus]